MTDVTRVVCATPGRRRFGKGLTLGWRNASSNQRGMLPIGLEKPRHSENAPVLLDLVNLRVHHQIVAGLALAAQLQPHLLQHRICGQHRICRQHRISGNTTSAVTTASVVTTAIVGSPGRNCGQYRNRGQHRECGLTTIYRICGQYGSWRQGHCF